ncbi:hypothetical protein [Levilactobacillus enshiensis]|uniref:hypothetical protein n=1 Tax=Levilactobacillus enshiensis TaxID=2590213 RepID=UPI00117B41A9|nr:hypothetical protein [Levilactobacillus enshiensis]
MFIYITYDADGYVTDYKLKETDGYTQVFILDSWVKDFARFATKYRYDSQSKELLDPKNRPESNTIDMQKDITSLQTTSKQMTASATTLAVGQTDLKTGLAQVQQAVTDLAIQQATNATEKQV